jgi:hypothetical protein
MHAGSRLIRFQTPQRRMGVAECPDFGDDGGGVIVVHICCFFYGLYFDGQVYFFQWAVPIVKIYRPFGAEPSPERALYTIIG